MAIRRKTDMTTTTERKGTGHARSDSVIEGNTVVIGAPEARGGGNDGPSPTAYAALVGCTDVIGHKCARTPGIEIGNPAFTMEVNFDRRGALLTEDEKVPLNATRLYVEPDDTCSEKVLQTMADETATFCAISKLFEKAGTDPRVA